MVIDTSALVAILRGEDDSAALVDAIAGDPVRLVGTPTWLEATAVMVARHGSGGEIALDALMSRLRLQLVDFTVDAARLARLGYTRYGKGVGDPGVLNYGDAMSYGVAMATGEPLLFKGDDFGLTDVAAVAVE